LNHLKEMTIRHFVYWKPVKIQAEIPENDEVDEENTQEELAEESEDESEKVTEPVNDIFFVHFIILRNLSLYFDWFGNC
jgi:hypothetical protein